MARFRSIDSDIWQNPRFRRMSDRAQKVFLYMVTTADDEGRLVVDEDSILEGAWHRAAKVKPSQVRDAVAEVASSGMILCYAAEGVTYAFLRGWFEHQPDPKTAHDESILPRPPITEAASWREARAVKAEYCAETGASPQGVHLRNALNWKRGVEAESTGVESKSTQVDSKSCSTVPYRTVPNRTVPSNAPPVGDAAPAAPVEDDPQENQPKEPTPSQQVILDAWEAHGLGEFPKGSPQGYSGLTKIVSEYGVPEVRRWIASFAGKPPPLPPGANAWNWFRTRFAAVRRPWEWDGSKRAPKPNRGILPPTTGKVETDEWGQQI